MNSSQSNYESLLTTILSDTEKCPVAPVVEVLMPFCGFARFALGCCHYAILILAFWLFSASVVGLVAAHDGSIKGHMT